MGCDTLDIKIGDFTVAACNIGTSLAGTGALSFGSYHTADTAATLCSTGYHLPKAEEWAVLLQEGYNLGLRGGTWNGSLLQWDTTQLAAFQNFLNLPIAGAGTATGGSIAWYRSASPASAGSAFRLLFDASSASVSSSALIDTLYPVRCFLDHEEIFTPPILTDIEGEDFPSTGSCVPYVVPANGTYRLEVWGAAGDPRYITSNPTYYYWRGGYAKGELSLDMGDTLYVCVGGQGGNSYGGRNGGGDSRHSSLDDNGAGGGATDIRLVGGAWDDPAGLLSRIIVAGGGGGGRGQNSDSNAGTEAGIGGRQDSSGIGCAANYLGGF